MSGFDKAARFVIKLEGGARIVEDTGGLTKFGISSRAFPDLDVASVDYDTAVSIYHENYWLPAHCHDMPWPMSLYMFDAAVNQGVSTAIKMLQASTNMLAVDGRWGPKTRAVVRKLLQEQPELLRTKFMAKRAQRYVGTRHYDKYGLGWLRRLMSVCEYGGKSDS